MNHERVRLTHVAGARWTGHWRHDDCRRVAHDAASFLWLGDDRQHPGSAAARPGRRTRSLHGNLVAVRTQSAECEGGVRGQAGVKILVAESAGVPTKSALQTDPQGWVDLMPPGDLKGWSRVPVPPGGKLGRAQWHVDTDREVLTCDGDGGHEMMRFGTRQLRNVDMLPETSLPNVTSGHAGRFAANSLPWSDFRRKRKTKIVSAVDRGICFASQAVSVLLREKQRARQQPE